MKRAHEFKTYVYEELVQHTPFTLLGVALGVVFVAVVAAGHGGRFGESEFHWAHVVHIFFSSAAGAALFRSYRDSLWKAVPVAVVSSIVLCTVSDILVPYLGLKWSGHEAHLHYCALEHPVRVAASALLGTAAGLAGLKFFEHCNRGFHLLHILVSTAASALYILSMLPRPDLSSIAVIAVTLFFALVIPCLAGDILVPLIFVRMREPYTHEHVHHSSQSRPERKECK